MKILDKCEIKDESFQNVYAGLTKLKKSQYEDGLIEIF